MLVLSRVSSLPSGRLQLLGRVGLSWFLAPPPLRRKRGTVSLCGMQVASLTAFGGKRRQPARRYLPHAVTRDSAAECMTLEILTCIAHFRHGLRALLLPLRASRSEHRRALGASRSRSVHRSRCRSTLRRAADGRSPRVIVSRQSGLAAQVFRDRVSTACVACLLWTPSDRLC